MAGDRDDHGIRIIIGGFTAPEIGEEPAEALHDLVRWRGLLAETGGEFEGCGNYMPVAPPRPLLARSYECAVSRSGSCAQPDCDPVIDR